MNKPTKFIEFEIEISRYPGNCDISYIQKKICEKILGMANDPLYYHRYMGEIVQGAFLRDVDRRDTDSHGSTLTFKVDWEKPDELYNSESRDWVDHVSKEKKKQMDQKIAEIVAAGYKVTLAHIPSDDIIE